MQQLYLYTISYPDYEDDYFCKDKIVSLLTNIDKENFLHSVKTATLAKLDKIILYTNIKNIIICGMDNIENKALGIVETFPYGIEEKIYENLEIKIISLDNTKQEEIFTTEEMNMLDNEMKKQKDAEEKKKRSRRHVLVPQERADELAKILGDDWHKIGFKI